MMRIAILDVADVDIPGLEGFASIAEMVTAWLAPHLPGAVFTSFNLAKGDALPELAAFDGYILPGSEAGVYDERPWMIPLRRFLESVRDAGKPLYGICFGHQLMADTFGGKAVKADKGFCHGSREFETAEGQSLQAHVSHQDQVIKVPPGATVTARSDYCPVGALAYDFPAMSTQFHPEYRPDFMAALADLLEGDLLEQEAAEESRQAVQQNPAAPDLHAQTVADFFRQHLA